MESGAEERELEGSPFIRMVRLWLLSPFLLLATAVASFDVRRSRGSKTRYAHSPSTSQSTIRHAGIDRCKVGRHLQNYPTACDPRGEGGCLSVSVTAVPTVFIYPHGFASLPH